MYNVVYLLSHDVLSPDYHFMASPWWHKKKEAGEWKGGGYGDVKEEVKQGVKEGSKVEEEVEVSLNHVIMTKLTIVM